MRVIKLDAIDSTNDFLKKIASQQYLENYVVVTARNQTNGKGQMGAKWTSEPGKNLIFSILIKDILLNINEIYQLNIAVSLSIIQVLESYKIPKLSIKWPNDIMTDHKKLGGILIENSIKTDGEIISIVGVGLNVNQNNFEDLPRATSLTLAKATPFDIDVILYCIINAIQNNMKRILNNESKQLWEEYNKYLFKKGIPMAFENQNGQQFMGIIQQVNENGKLEMLLEDDTIVSFEIKEIQMLY